jgi:hypothetical protein
MDDMMELVVLSTAALLESRSQGATGKRMEDRWMETMHSGGGGAFFSYKIWPIPSEPSQPLSG